MIWLWTATILKFIGFFNFDSDEDIYCYLCNRSEEEKSSYCQLTRPTSDLSHCQRNLTTTPSLPLQRMVQTVYSRDTSRRRDCSRSDGNNDQETKKVIIPMNGTDLETAPMIMLYIVYKQKNCTADEIIKFFVGLNSGPLTTSDPNIRTEKLLGILIVSTLRQKTV